MTAIPVQAERVRAAAAALGLAIEVKLVPASTRSAQEAAQVVGVAVGRIVKSLVFKGKQTGAAYLILVSGSNRVNEGALEPLLVEAVERPDAAFVREATGYAIGGIPPIGLPRPVRTLMDRDLLQYETVWAAAGTPHAVFEAVPGALGQAIAAEIVAIT